ncbi:DUF1707 SHOCT-like domain-containing protein [Nonomuraea sp. H19]|uniref:DUF1707 SHOCT-like domain-containing protein n=1 Tax=Nonomuraea sp. H19 TaxID=3452206 RepID=UPI003F8970F8
MTTQEVHVQGLEKSCSPALRASDEDRDRVTEVLRVAVADGRLDPVEFDERLDAALSARPPTSRYWTGRSSPLGCAGSPVTRCRTH